MYTYMCTSIFCSFTYTCIYSYAYWYIVVKFWYEQCSQVMDLGWSYARFSGVAIVTLFTMTHVHIVASLLCLYELDKLLVHQTMHIVL